MTTLKFLRPLSYSMKFLRPLSYSMKFLRPLMLIDYGTLEVSLVTSVSANLPLGNSVEINISYVQLP